MPNDPTTNPAISVIVPVHNVEAYVEPCIASLKAQTRRDFEAIIVDDGSTDASGERAQKAIDGDARFRLIHQKNQGLSGARNTGLDLATGDIIGFLDGDDQYAPQFLARLSGALEQFDTPWVSCGLCNVHADGSQNTHSTMHSHPNLDQLEADTLWPLASWMDIIDHYPSAWNKLYRRDLIANLRFDDGTWFEDHAWYCRLADRAQTLAHIPEPLYIQTRDRVGQITGTDSERVFEQFPVLDLVDAIMSASQKPGHDIAIHLLGRRLCLERSHQLQDIDRRDRFIRRAADWMDRHPWPDQPVGATASDAGPTKVNDSVVSIVLPWTGHEGLLTDSLASISQQRIPGVELIIVSPDRDCARRAEDLATAPWLPDAHTIVADASGAGPARNTGLDAATGRFVVFLDAGDRLLPTALADWSETMAQQEADLGISKFRIGIGQGPVHSGVHDQTILDSQLADDNTIAMTPQLAMAIHAMPSAKIFSRRFLLDNKLRFGDGALESWSLTIEAALRAKTVVHLAWPGVEISEAPDGRSLWRAQVPPKTLMHAIDAMSDHLDGALPGGWKRHLFARAIWEKIEFSEMPGAVRSRYILNAAQLARQRGLLEHNDPLDPYVSPLVHRLVTDRDPG